MKKIRKKYNKGITLIALVITVTILIILASVATHSGIDAIKTSKYTKFVSELKIMQTYVNDLYEKYKNNEKIKINEKDINILDIGKAIDSNNIKAQEAFQETTSGITDTSRIQIF